jgi:hypothetical protein
MMGEDLAFTLRHDNNKIAAAVENYFNYFTEIEERFQRRRGTGLLLSTLDWALIETWKDAGIPLQAVLAGIDATFDRYDRRPSKTRKVNSLAYCSQEVLAAAEDMKEAAAGVLDRASREAPGLSSGEIATFLVANAARLRQVDLPDPVRKVSDEAAATLDDLAATLENASGPPRLEDLERHLTALEEKLMAALTVAASEAELVSLAAEADREIGPYRSKMPAFQIEQLKKQFVHKRLLEKATIPRLSLFYM